MTHLYGFSGQPLCSTSLLLGEGPTYDRHTDTAYWFNIVGAELHELSLSTGLKRVHALPCMASVLARVDADRQILATEHGLYLRDVATGALSLSIEIERDRPDMRSNDGRVHPSGALWFGTMTKTGEGRAGAGTIYHVARGVVTPLFEGIGIPNGICFSPDGTLGYYVDTMDNRYMRVALDPNTGLPIGAPQLFSDESGEPGGVDGSVCDAEGKIWNARWGVGEVHCYAPSGEKLACYQLPAAQTTCPAFIGRDAGRMLVTSAREGLDAADLRNDPQAGQTFDLGITVKGRFEPDYKI